MLAGLGQVPLLNHYTVARDPESLHCSQESHVLSVNLPISGARVCHLPSCLIRAERREGVLPQRNIRAYLAEEREKNTGQAKATDLCSIIC